MKSENIMEVRNLHTSFFTHVGEVEAVRDISFDVKKNEILGIVGESGCGKSATLMSLMQLIQDPGKVKSGEVWFKDKDILKYNNKQMMKIRGNNISMIFQDPMTSLNPVYRIGNQITETILTHEKISKKEAQERTIKLLTEVGIPSPRTRINAYPHEFSGGMRQRVMITMALACHPDLLLADEPTTALDVTIQAQILDLLDKIRKKEGATIILVTHDLGVVAELCDRVIVLYGGKIMEEGTATEIFTNPVHPYTQGLMRSVPKVQNGSKKRLVPIPGSPPVLVNPPTGCPFYARCEHSVQLCKTHPVDRYKISGTHFCSCHLQDPLFKEQIKKGGLR